MTGRLLATALLAAAALPTTYAIAQTNGTWNTNAGGNWSVTNNWLSGLVANGAGSTANLTFDISGTGKAITNDTAITIGVLNIGDANAGNTYTMAGGAGSLTFNNNGSGAQINQVSTSRGDTISAGFTLGDNLTISNASSANALTLSGIIAGASSYGITFNSGTVTVSGVNTYSGNTTLTNTALVRLGNGNNRLGAGTLTLGGGTLSVTGVTGRSLSNAVTLGGTVAIGDSVGTGTITLGGVVGGTGTINVNSTGGLILTNANTLSGTINVNAGTLSALGGTSTSFGTSAINLGDTSGTANATLLGRSGTLANAITVRAGSSNNTLSLIGIGGVGTTIFSGGMTLNQAVTLDSKDGTLTFQTGGITGSSTITITNSAATPALTSHRVSLAGANSGYTGSVVVLSNGTLRISDNAGLSASNTVQVNSGALLEVNTGTGTIGGLNDSAGSGGTVSVVSSSRALAIGGSGSYSFNGALQDNGASTLSLTKSGSGTQVLGGANTFSGGTTLSAGTLRAGNDSALGTGTFTLSGGTFASDGSTPRTITNGITMGGNVQLGDGIGTGALTFSNVNLGTSTRTLTLSNSTTVAGAITNTGGLTKEGAGTLVLSAANTFSGGTTLSAGTLRAGNDGALGTGTFTLSGGTFASDSSTSRTITNAVTMGGDVQLGDSTGTGALTMSNINLNGATRTLTVSNSTTVAGVISNGSGAPGLTKNGTGTLTLSVSNTFSGGMTLSAGTLRAGNDSALGTGTFTVNGGTFASDSSSARTITNAIDIAGDITFGDAVGAGALTFSATGTENLGAATRTLTTVVDTTIASALTNASGNITKAGAGTLYLSNSGNNFATLTINAGRVSLQTNATITGLAGSGGDLAVVAGTLALNSSSSSTFGQAISGAGGLTKSGTGTLALSGSNSYTGTTKISGGVLKLDSANALPGGIGSTGGLSALVLDGGVIGLASGDFSRNIVGLTPGATDVGWLANGSGGFAAYGADRNVNFGGAGASVTWSATGGVFGSNFILSDASADAMVTVVNTINLNSGTRTVTVNNGSAAVDATLGGSLTGGGTLVKQGSGVLALTASNTIGTFRIDAGTLRASHINALGTGGGVTAVQLTNGATLELGADVTAGGGLTGSGGTVTAVNGNRSLTVREVSGVVQTFSGILQDAGTNVLSLIKTGAGTQTLSGNNTYSGTTTISAGTLQIGNGGTSGSIGSTSRVTNNGTLAYSRSDNLTASYAISGTGNLTKSGNGTLTLAGNNTFSGGTTIAAGTLQVAGNGNLGTTNSTVTISNGGTLRVTSAGTISNAITIGTGNGSLSNASGGTLVFAGTATKDGTVLYSRAGSGTNVFTGVIQGTSANSDFVVDGGTTVFSNVMTYNGPTIITNGGTLVLAVDDAMPSGSNLILGGGTFRVGVENYNADALLSLGTLTLTANSTIDLGGFGTTGDRILKFADSSLITWTGTLTITNWQGVAQTQSDVTKLLFGTGGLDSTQLGQIYFANQNINGGVLVGVDGELTPIPEAPVVAGAAALALFILWRERRRIGSALPSLRERLHL